VFLVVLTMMIRSGPIAQIPLVASRHDTSRHYKHDVSCEPWRDVLCRACCAELVPTWQMTKKQ